MCVSVCVKKRGGGGLEGIERGEWIKYGICGETSGGIKRKRYYKL